ncbi:hypothetical protein [Brevibacterium aurantiacum]|uniref:Uncharacterized protein n=1 Tax=Brevibacterium aurantiacum TaxID=273384 RepID=A0A556C6G8_BREAU|nr:hypothetical protein [Brevibacterium aurantiacum]TSI12598.1 hypothetical protein FO013_19160 [Brevibacterium aurantiacum]
MCHITGEARQGIPSIAAGAADALDARMLNATIDWQIRPTADEAFATNDHSDAGWDAQVLDEFEALGVELAPLAQRLTNVLTRFEGMRHRGLRPQPSSARL